jgi:hypothetical protein
MRHLRRHHDIGGLAAGPIAHDHDGVDAHDYAPWEKKVDAVVRLLSAKGVMTVDELRRGIEELGPGIYDELGYYERWISSVANILVEKGVIHVDELGRRMAAIEADWGEP